MRIRRLDAALLLLATGSFACGPGGGDALRARSTARAIGRNAGNELRGVWITRFAYSNQATLEGIIDRAAAANFNAVFVQIRGEGDAYYHSTHEPWSRTLTGTFGRDPGWDPLQVAIDRAHSQGMELHAYFNVFSGWAVGALPIRQAEGPVQHPLVVHPEWTAVDANGRASTSEYVWITPGDPAARAHIVATATELLQNYEVDGLHLDRIRTSGPGFSYDAATRAAYDAAHAADPSLTLASFVPNYMTESVNQMVAELYDAIAQTRPNVKLSAAVWGIHNRAVLGSCTGGVSQGRFDYYQDSIEWVRRGTIDALVPMMYWPLNAPRCTDWARLLNVFLNAQADRQIWAGMHALDITVTPNRWDPDGMKNRIAHARNVGAAGTVVFASTYVDSNQGWGIFPGTAAAPGPYADPDPAYP